MCTREIGRSKSFKHMISRDIGIPGKTLQARHAGFNLWIVLLREFNMNPVDFLIIFLALCLITNTAVVTYILLKENKKTYRNHINKG